MLLLLLALTPLRRVCPDATKHKNREKKCDDRFGVQVDRGGGAIQSDVG